MKSRNSLQNFLSKFNRLCEEMLPMDESILPQKYTYNRPKFITDKYEKIKYLERPILTYSTVVTTGIKLGYAETCNNRLNFDEDQACFGQIFNDEEVLEYKLTDNVYYFCLFDGHLGWGPSYFGRENIGDYLKNHLKALFISPSEFSRKSQNHQKHLIIGSIEKCFEQLDEDLREQHFKFNLRGGATVLVCLFYKPFSSGINNNKTRDVPWKIIVANAGDSRAIYVGVTSNNIETNSNINTFANRTPLCPINGTECDLAISKSTNNLVVAPSSTAVKDEYSITKNITLTTDCSPINERDRIYGIIASQPHLINKTITLKEFSRPLSTRDLKKPVLYREPQYAGWFEKIVDQDDLKLPVISYTGKKGRLLGRLSVIRGIGNFRLRSSKKTFPGTNTVAVKPFLTAKPKITSLDTDQYKVHMNVSDLQSTNCKTISIDNHYYESSASEPSYQQSQQSCTNKAFLIMATDGVWDYCTDAILDKILMSTLRDYSQQYLSQSDFVKQTLEETIAQKIVGYCRGNLVIRKLSDETDKTNNVNDEYDDGCDEDEDDTPIYELDNGLLASEDDISCFVLQIS